VRIRPAGPDDASVLAELTTQLGYPSTPADLTERLEPLLGDGDHLVLVAADADDGPVGWIHVAIDQSLASGTHAVIAGLVIDERHRSAGIGLALLEAGEAWARDRGIGTMVVRSRIVRERAHRFYEREGYTLDKTSYVFSKSLGRPAQPRSGERAGAAGAPTRPDHG
jgi:GNAT superfamily N-acetyltransferase